MKIDLKKVGGRLLEIRGSLTQGVIAKQMGISQNMVYRYEQGLSSPSFEYLAWASRHGGVAIDWIITGENPKVFADVYAKAQSRHGAPISDAQRELLVLYEGATKEIQDAAKAVLTPRNGGDALKKRKASA